MATEILNRKFICAESKFGVAGHNKFWFVKVYDDGQLLTEYGRVGDSGQSTSKRFGNKEVALNEAEKLIRKKLKGKKGEDSVYKEVEIVGTVNPSSAPKAKSIGKGIAQLIANGKKEIEELVKLLDDQNTHEILDNTSLTYDKNTGLFSTPLGVVGQKSIDEARTVLAEIKPYVMTAKWDNTKATKLVEDYMALIPQNIGRQRPSLKTLFWSADQITKHSSILDSLQASLDIITKPKDDDKKDDLKNPFDIVLDLVEDKKEKDRIKKLYENNKGSHECSHLKVNRIFSIRLNKMYSDFISKGKKLNPVETLWHGTRVSNVLSIMAKGFVVPPSSASYCTGRMFSDGIYFANCSTKSLQYAYGTWGNKSRDNHCFMFICEVAMGKSFEPTHSLSSFPKGYNSIFAKTSKTGLRYDEIVVPNAYQINPIFLVEFTN